MQTIFDRAGGLLKSIVVPTTIAFAWIASILAPIDVAFADYSAVQNHLDADVPFGPDNVNTVMTGGTSWTIEFVATTTITQFDRIDVALCRNDGTTGGIIELEVRSSASTTGPIIASSTLAINNGNVYATSTPGQFCDYGVQGVNEHMSTFVLDRNIQTVAGVTWWFRFREVGNTASLLVSGNNGNTYGFADNLRLWIGNTAYKLNSGLDHASPLVTGFGLGVAPTVQNIYATSSVAVVCTTFDVGCYISSALTWAFYPTATISIVDAYPALASTTPFAYLFAAGELYGSLWDGTATGTESLTVTFAPLGIATSTLTVGSLASVATFAGADSLFANLRSWLSVFMYLLLTWGVTKFVLKVIGVQTTLSIEQRMISYGKSKGIL